MCQQAICRRCEKLTWKGQLISLKYLMNKTIVGCGQHKDAVLRNIPMKDRCICEMKREKAKEQHENYRSESYRWTNHSYPR